jgi:hypothetical protein
MASKQKIFLPNLTKDTEKIFYIIATEILRLAKNLNV